MLKLIVKALGLIAVLLFSCAAGALSMGGINVISYLGEPLKAEIDLNLVGKDDKSKISAHLASPEAFKSAGLNYSESLPSVKFQIQTRANGSTYLSLTTTQAVSEPFISLLVDLSWPSGQLIREYTFLLDPPGFKPEQPKPQEVQPLQPVVSIPEQHIEAKKEESLQMGVASPLDEKTVAASAIKPATKPVTTSTPEKSNLGATLKTTETLNTVTGAIKVNRGDTLRKIAGELKAPDVSLERMVVALYRANENQFVSKNMNRLQTGKILRVPDGSEINKVAQDDAVSEIRAQAEDWNDYRQKLAAAVGSVSEQAPTQKAAGKITTSVADKTPADKKPAKEVVRLSKGESVSDKAAAGDKTKSMQDKMNSMEEETIAKNKMLKEEKERIALLEKNMNDMHRLIELKGKLPQADSAVPARAEQAHANSGVAPEIKPVAASAIVSVSAVQPQNLVPSKTVEPAATSILDEILAKPLYWAGGILLGLGGLGAILARRRASSENEAENLDHTVTHIVEPVAPSPDTGDFTQVLTENITEPVGAEETDPIKEAELFLNFGRDVQAEEVLKDALKKEPGNQNIRLKLMSIYEGRKDTGNFETLAKEVQASGDANAWAQASEMGRALEPGNSLYANGENEIAVAGESIPEPVATEQDISVEELESSLPAPTEAPEAVALVEPLPSHASPDRLDFEHVSISPAEEISSAEEISPAEEAIVPVASELAEELRLEPSELPRDEELENVLDALPLTESLSLIKEPADSAEVHEKLELEENDHSFEISDNSEHKASDLISPKEETTEVEAEMAETDIPFILEIPPEATSADDNVALPETPNKPLTSEAAVDFSEIDLNLDRHVEVASEEIKDIHWHDVATKLDLARAYHEMGDASGAREILEEVLSEGDAQQRDSAQAMLERLSV